MRALLRAFWLFCFIGCCFADLCCCGLLSDGVCYALLGLWVSVCVFVVLVVYYILVCLDFVVLVCMGLQLTGSLLDFFVLRMVILVF